MKATQLSPIERAYLNAVWDYHRENSSETADTIVSKEVFRLIKAGLYELAAVEAGKNPVTCEIFSRAADAAEKRRENGDPENA